MRATGFGLDEYVKIKDESGKIWTGLLEHGSEDQVRYYLTDTKGNRITGVANGHSLTFRDDRGRTWKGFVD